MNAQEFRSEEHIAGLLLTSCFALFSVGGLLFTARNGMAGRPAPSRAYLVVERSFVMAAVIITALGLFALAEIISQEASSGVLIAARLSAVMYSSAAALILFSEVKLLRDGRFPYLLVTIYVVVALIAQAIVGIVLLRTGFLPSWIGWTALIWNIALLLIFSIVRPREIYYPALHHFIPLLIGIALLRRG
jgi:sterol desaturase/sphingolipid hydroxylase (fatty acid hydroxylase superfamily)